MHKCNFMHSLIIIDTYLLLSFIASQNAWRKSCPTSLGLDNQSPVLPVGPYEVCDYWITDDIPELGLNKNNPPLPKQCNHVEAAKARKNFLLIPKYRVEQFLNDCYAPGDIRCHMMWNSAKTMPIRLMHMCVKPTSGLKSRAACYRHSLMVKLAWKVQKIEFQYIKTEETEFGKSKNKKQKQNKLI